MRRNLTVWALWLLGCLFAESATAQSDFFQFKIKDQGIYRISTSEASKLGLPDLSQLSIFGYPGMLPQQLDSAQLKLQEIPAMQIGESLYFFLTGPNSTAFSEGKIEFSPHLFTDSLSYLVAKNESPKRIIPSEGLATPAEPSQIWYSLTPFLVEETNILNSGRNWYSDPIRQGQSLNINLGLTTPTASPWLLSGKLMAQSFTSSTMRILSGNTLLGEVAFNPIPNATYGVKGREEYVDVDFIPSGGALSQVRFTYQGAGPESAGYLSYFVIGTPFANSDLKEGIFESAARDFITLGAAPHTWEVSDFYQPAAFSNTAGGSASGQKWVLFSPEKIPDIRSFARVDRSLRDAGQSPELLIITAPQLLSSANKLSAHKNSRGIVSTVVTTEAIFQAFGYGNPDLGAIRNFIAKTYHQDQALKNVLILGKGTFDAKKKLGGRPNLVPIYSSRESLNPLTTFSSDDYLTLIDWGQGLWEESRDGDEKMQIGIGRLPAINFAEANEMVEKIIRYENTPYRSPESSTVTFLADDADNNIHVRDSEAHAGFLTSNHAEFLLDKLYLDRFEQEKTGNIQRSPEAKSALEKTLDQGTLILNYIGHGNETTLTAEEIFKVSDIANWPRQQNLALWVTATCEFGRHDSPFIRSAAEELLFAKEKGAIALLTTGRPVFSSVNFALNEAFIEEVFQKEEGNYQNLGAIFKNTKNQSLNGALNRNFSLLGDPSLRLALPELDIAITSITDVGTDIQADTLQALQELLLRAEVIDPLTQAILPGFNGDYRLEVRDKPLAQTTLGDESSPYEFEEEKVLIFKGEGEIKAGVLEARFFVPKGINPDFGNGRIRIQGWDTTSGLQAMGGSSPVIGGIRADSGDKIGPDILPKVNGQNSGPFIFSTPSLQIEGLLKDPSGINVSGYVPDQNLLIQLNDETPILLNELYLAKNGSFEEGSFQLRMSGFQEGKNQVTIQAWDNAGNKSILGFEVEIAGSETLEILEHKVYPNPASTESNFEIRHNRPGDNLLLTLDVYALTGQILFSESFRLLRAEEIIDDLVWIFFQSQTKYPAKGTYIYKLELQSESDFTSDSASGKIVIR